MARKFKAFIERDKPKKRGSRKHKKSLNKNEKDRNGLDVTRARVKAKNNLFYLLTNILCYPICIGH